MKLTEPGLMVLVGLAALSSMIAGNSVELGAQAPVPISSLTAQNLLLPRDCRLAPAGSSFVAYPGVKENPWAGTGTTAALIRDVVAGQPQKSEEQLRAFQVQGQAVGLAEGYRAVYLSANGSTVDVYAVRYSNEALAPRSETSRVANVARHVVVLGPIAAVVTSETENECSAAILKHVESLRGDEALKSSIASALVSAKASGRYVLLNFGADWCAECRILTKTFEEPEVSRFLKANFVDVKVEVGEMVGLNYTDKNLDLTLKYGAFATKEAIAIPFIVILDGDGKVLARTNNGEWKHAPAVTPENVLRDLQRWAPKR